MNVKMKRQNQVIHHALFIIMKWKFPHRPDPEPTWSFGDVE